MGRCETLELPLLTTLAVDASSETNTTPVSSNPIQSIVSNLNPRCTSFIPSRISFDHTYTKTLISSDCAHISKEKNGWTETDEEEQT